MRFAGSQLTNFLSGTNFDNIGKAGIVSRANENNASVISDSYVDRADIAAEATVQSAKYGASATRAQGSAQGQSSMFSGLASGIGSIAGGIAKMPGAGGTPGPAVPAVDRTSLGHGIPGSVGGNGLPMYGPSW